jgi:hypothetical protein
MNKRVALPKLTLHRETLRTLETASLELAAAGIGKSGRDWCSIAYSKCECTVSFEIGCPV